LSQGRGLAFAMLCGKRIWKTIERIRRGEGDVAARGDGMARVFSYDCDVLIQLLLTGAI
jgi:hypothetical protein